MFLNLFNFPVAQKAQERLQPTCDEIQAVILFFEGIKTPSQITPSLSLKPSFIV